MSHVLPLFFLYLSLISNRCCFLDLALFLGLNEMDRIQCCPLLALSNRKARRSGCFAPLGKWAHIWLIWKGHLHLGIAPTKMMDRMEWMMEKATEIGVDEVSFLNCKFSERRLVKLVRLDKIITAAVKQSHKAWKPQVNEMVHFNHFLEQPIQGRKYIAHCYEEIPRTELFDELRKPSDSDDATVLVGPEGDFSIDEVKAAVEAGWVSVSLGQSRLRTETAGLSAVMMMQLAQK